MDRQEALRVLGLGDGDDLTINQLRKQYLKRALATHPDKNKGDKKYTEEFSQVQEAHALLLASISDNTALVAEKIKADELLNLLMRAIQGDNVELELQQLGIYRPSELFGVDLTIPFDRRPPPPPTQWQSSDDLEPVVDIREAFRDIFQDDGLDEDGNPLHGWARPPTVDLDDL